MSTSPKFGLTKRVEAPRSVSPERSATRKQSRWLTNDLNLTGAVVTG